MFDASRSALRSLISNIKNQFISAIIVIMLLALFGIYNMITLEMFLGSKILAIAAIIIISSLASFMIFKLYKTTQEFRQKSNQATRDSINNEELRKKNIIIASQRLCNLIVGLGEHCLKSQVKDNQRIFVFDALSQVIEIKLEDRNDGETLLTSILHEIKSTADAEITQNDVFSEVLPKQNKVNYTEEPSE